MACNVSSECNTTQPRFGICPRTRSCCRQGPQGPQGPPGAQGGGFDSFLNYYQTDNPIAASSGGNLIINQSGTENGSDLSYNDGTGVITVNTAGVYVFNWHFNGAAALPQSDFNLIITLENVNSGERLNLSGAIIEDSGGSALISGSAAAQLTEGTELAFKNRADSAVVTVPAVTATDAYSASFSAFRIA